MGLVCSHKQQAIGKEEIVFSCTIKVLIWVLEKISSLKGLSSSGMGCPGEWLSHHP